MQLHAKHDPLKNKVRIPLCEQTLEQKKKQPRFLRLLNVPQSMNPWFISHISSHTFAFPNHKLVLAL